MSVTSDVVLASDERDELGRGPMRRIDSPHALHATEKSQSTVQVEVAVSGGFTLDDPAVMLEIEEPTAAMIAAVAGETYEARREQLQLHVAQLAGHLRERLR